jgi:hypothetical protein
MSGRRSAGHSPAEVGGKVIPDQDDRPAELQVRGVQQARALGLGEAFALVRAGAAGSGAVDQPGPVAGPGADQCGQRDALAALRGHLDLQGAAAAAPGAAFGRTQALAGLVFEAEPGTQVRCRAFITGQVSCRLLRRTTRSVNGSRARTCS